MGPMDKMLKVYDNDGQHTSGSENLDTVFASDDKMYLFIMNWKIKYTILSIIISVFYELYIFVNLLCQLAQGNGEVCNWIKKMLGWKKMSYM